MFFAAVVYHLLDRFSFRQKKARITKTNRVRKRQIKSNQISLFLTQLQLQQNELKLNTQNAQSREKSLKLVTK